MYCSTFSLVTTGASSPLATEHLAIVQSAAARNAAVLGASMLAIENALSPETLTLVHA